MILYGKSIWLIYINYVNKFEGHKLGREKTLENDSTVFRDRILFLIAVDTFQIILSFFYNAIFKVNNHETVFPFVSHLLAYGMISYAMIQCHILCIMYFMLYLIIIYVYIRRPLGTPGCGDTSSKPIKFLWQVFNPLSLKLNKLIDLSVFRFFGLSNMIDLLKTSSL